LGICAGRVAIVTGAGRGLGRAHALELARQGARVVVNDIGTGRDGSGSSPEPADAVVAEIEKAGGTAVASIDDVADWDGAAQLVATALAAYGRLDVLVNNAGFLRDRMIVSMTEDDWDAVVRVHLKGHFCPTRHAAAHWRERHKRGEPVDARVINTSSGAGLAGSVGQASYSAAKAGIAAFTQVAAAELGRYGIMVNAIAPAARTRMTEAAMPDAMRRPANGFDAMAPENVSPLVAWLASAEAAQVTGMVFEVEGGIVRPAVGWRPGPQADNGARWDPATLGPVVARLLAEMPPAVPVYGA
jgi:NAD(P)-dependent dehydrogenase (short-subunit alcohol dehydrogenase family)